jgi:phosphotransferase system HPr (HPr) family protein
VQRKVHIRNPHGLHLRPITAFVELAKRYQSTVMVRKDDQCVDGKSPWDLLSLVALPGTELLLLVSGPDATEALQALGDLLENYVIPDEPESDLLPKS